MPALHSVILPLRRNPAINAAALNMIDARERRGLIRDLVKQTRAEDLIREATTRQREDEIRDIARELTSDSREERRARVEAMLEQARRNENNPSRGRSRGPTRSRD